MNRDVLLEAVGLYKSYGGGASRVDVLNGIDLTVRAGETIALVGASGAGKSTLLHLLGTLDRPSAGEVRYQGENVFRKNDVQLAEFRNRTIGFVFQFHHLLGEFTALENVMMPALINGVKRDAAAETARQLLAGVGLSHRLTHKPGELSGGEQQRVAIARALVMKPAVLLADEPTGNLDMKTSAGIHELFAELQQARGLALLVVTHNEPLAARMERVVRLVDGKIE
ncbi:MAG TPA: ABC transporter ATP-binding protein [Geobacteraceae bacterium]